MVVPAAAWKRPNASDPLGEDRSHWVKGAPITTLQAKIAQRHALGDVGPFIHGGDGDLVTMGAQDAYGKIADELRSLPHVLSVAITQPVPFDYRVTVIMDEWDWKVWQHVHEQVDHMARECVRQATMTAEIMVDEHVSGARPI